MPVPARCLIFLGLVGITSGCGTPEPTVPKPPGGTGGGRYEISGSKEGVPPLSLSGSTTDKKPIEAPWPVTKEQFETLKVGMTMPEVKKLLGLSELTFDPDSPESAFHVVFKHDGGAATVVFSDPPDMKLSKLSSEGLK